MKTLAAVSIHQYEQAVAAVAHYEGVVRLGLTAILDETGAVHAHHGLSPPKGREPIIGMVAFGSDHGLCGWFNEDLAEIPARRWLSSPRTVSASWRSGTPGNRIGESGLNPGADVLHSRRRDRYRANPAPAIAGVGAMAEHGDGTVVVVPAAPARRDAPDAAHAGVTAA